MPDLRLRMSDRNGEGRDNASRFFGSIWSHGETWLKRRSPLLCTIIVQHGHLDIPMIGVAKNESGTEVVRTRNMPGLERPTIRGLFIAQRQ
jgi:hypothetical protein